MKWITKIPEEVIQNCLLTRERKDGSRYVELGAVVPGEHRYGLIAYMSIEHFLDNNNNWKSEYKGDELPEKSGRYICCKEDEKRIFLFYFDSKKCTFGGSSEMIAFMEVPSPYMGKSRLKLAA